MNSANGSTQDLVTVSTRKAVLKRRTRLERRLIFATASLALLGLSLLIGLVVVASKFTRGLRMWTQEECRSEQCIYSAAMLLQGLDQSADPCKDFYQYACGRWSKYHPIPDSHIYNSWFLERQEALQRRVTEVLKANSSASDPKPVTMAHRLYKSCIDTDQLDKLGLEPMLDLLSNLSLPRGIPTKESAQDFQLAKTLSLAQRFISKDILIEIGLEKDDLNPDSDKMILHLTPPQGNNPLPEVLVEEDPERPTAAPLTSKELVLLRISYMARIMALVDFEAHKDESQYDVNATELSSIALRILLTDTALNSGSSRDKDLPSTKPFRTTFAALQEILANATQTGVADQEQGASTEPTATEPLAELLATSAPPEAPRLAADTASSGLKVDFRQYLEVLLEGINATVDVNNDPVYVTDLPYFKNMAILLAKSRPETIQRLVWWKVVETVAVHTSQIMREMRFTLLSTFYRGLQPTPRPKFCVRTVKTFLHMALSYKMAVKNPLADTTNRMLTDITSAFEELVRAVPWMDAATKAATLDKAAAVTAFIGYPEWLLQPGQLETYYEGVEMAEDSFLWNMLNMKAREVKRLLGSLGAEGAQQDSRDRWTTDPIEVNAFYSRSINSIAIPAGILQVPFYFLGLEALNYGAIGSILGHELTHGFDIEGKEHDKKGLRNPFWRKEVTEEYNDRAQCFVRQYDRFTVRADLTVNGSQTLAENIADNGGIREALLAYRGYTRRHGQEPALPGLNDFSHEQLFFLSFANVWCQNSDAQFDALQLRDSHSPARFRVIGALSNSPDFATIWGCPAGSAMNPDDKCIIW